MYLTEVIFHINYCSLANNGAVSTPERRYSTTLLPSPHADKRNLSVYTKIMEAQQDELHEHKNEP